MNKWLKYSGILLLGLCGYGAGFLIERAYLVYEQHVAMWQWVNDTNARLNPRPLPPAQPTPEPTKKETK